MATLVWSLFIYIASFYWCCLETVKKWWRWIRDVLFLLYFLVFDCVLLPYPLFFFSVLLSSFLLCYALLSLSSPHCLVVFPLFVLSFFSLSCLPPLLCFFFPIASLLPCSVRIVAINVQQSSMDDTVHWQMQQLELELKLHQPCTNHHCQRKKATNGGK